jgi:hypothetical protein
MLMKKSFLLSFYVEDRYGRHYGLGKVYTDRSWLSDKVMREKVARGVDMRGWNYVACGGLKFYSSEGPGLPADAIHNVYERDGELRVELISESWAEKVKAGDYELPRKRGMATAWCVSGGEMAVSKSDVEEVSEVEKLVELVLTKESLGKYTKAELMDLSKGFGVEGLSMSMKKGEMIDYIIENKK